MLGCCPSAKCFSVLHMAPSCPWNHCIPFLHSTGSCLLPSPFFRLFPCESSGSGGWKFIFCPSSWFADFPPAKSHVCWKKPSIPAQERIPLKEREGRSGRGALECLGSLECLFLFQACGSGLISAVHSPSQRSLVHSVGAICQTDGSARRHFQKKLEQGGRGRNKQPAGWHAAAHPLPARENLFPSVQKAADGFWAVCGSLALCITTHPCAP